MIQILQVEQRPDAPFPAQKALADGGIDCAIELVAKDKLLVALDGEPFDLIFSDGQMTEGDVHETLDAARKRSAHVSLICILPAAGQKAGFLELIARRSSGVRPAGARVAACGDCPAGIGEAVVAAGQPRHGAAGADRAGAFAGARPRCNYGDCAAYRA